MSSREELRVMTRLARMYHTEGIRQSEIAARLDLSQAKVSRLLKKAQQEGIVRITVAAAPGTNPGLEDTLQQRYGIKLALVVDTDPDDEKTLMADLGAAGAYYLETTLRSGDFVGLSSWSATLLATVNAMQPVHGLQGVRIVQAVGGVGDPAASGHASRLTGRLAGLVRGEATYLTAPGLAGSPDSARALCEDPFTAATLNLLDQLTLALVGIGEVEPSSTLAQSGNAHSPEELEELERQGAVGDVCLHFYDADGRPLNSPLDDRVVGITVQQLRTAPRTVGVAGGRRKHHAVRGALRSGLIDILITDHATAQWLIDSP